MSENVEQSRPSRQVVLDLLRFPLAVVIVAVHLFSIGGLVTGGEQLDVSGMPLFGAVLAFVDAFLRGQSVPIYFFISGYVFFREGTFGKALYGHKLRNRVKTLFIPYLIWNSLAIILLLLKFLPVFSDLRAYGGGAFTPSVQGFLSCFWEYHDELNPAPAGTAMAAMAAESSVPINAPLWFLRDLMILVVASPVLYWLLRRLKGWFVVATGLLWFVVDQQPGLFFFSWGAYMSLNSKDMLQWFGRIKTPSLIAYPLISIACIAVKGVHPEWVHWIKQAGILAGLPFAYNLAALLLRRGICRENRTLAASSFFIYVAHGLCCQQITKVVLKVFSPESDVATTLCFLLSLTLCVGGLLGAFVAIRRWTPGLLRVVAGRK